MQDLISRLLERKPTRRLGMLNGRAGDIKRHKWFDGLDWDALEARKMEPPRLPKDDSAKRLRELTVRLNICTVSHRAFNKRDELKVFQAHPQPPYPLTMASCPCNMCNRGSVCHDTRTSA